MNKNLVKRSINRLLPTKQNFEGFALPIVIVVGIFMILSGLTLTAQLFRSSITSKKILTNNNQLRSQNEA